MIKITISAYPRNLPAFPTEHSFFRCCKYHKPKGNGVINAPIKRYASLNHPIKSHFSTDINITIFLWFSHGFHGEIAIFLWFSHGFHGEICHFPVVFLWFSPGTTGQVYGPDGQPQCSEAPTASPMPRDEARQRRWICEHRWQGVAGAECCDVHDCSCP